MLLTVLLPKLASQSSSNNSIQLMGPINMNYKLGIYRLNHLSNSDEQPIELQWKPAHQVQRALNEALSEGQHLVTEGVLRVFCL